MKTGRHARVAIILVLALIVTSISIMPQAAVYSYGTDGTNGGLTEAEELALEEDIYRDTTMKIWYANTDEVSSAAVAVRYYADMPNVPYIKLYDFYMLNEGAQEGDFVVEKTGDHKYEAKNFKVWDGEYYALAEIDTLEDSLHTDSIREFMYVGDEAEGSDSEPIQFGVKSDMSKIIYEAGKDYVHIDFDDKYHIDLRTGGTNGEDLYFPLAIANDIFASPRGNIMQWDGEIIYVKNPNLYEDIFDSEAAVDEDGGIYYVENDAYKAFTDRIFNGNSGAERPADLAEFAFNELNFQLDHAYGFPGREIAHPMYTNHQTLETFLEGYTAKNGAVRGTDIMRLLKSQNWGEYILGYYCLSVLLYDGGHSNARIGESIDRRAYSEINSQIRTACENYPALEAWVNENGLYDYDVYCNSVTRDVQRREAYGISSDETYLKSGDTAIYIMDTFEADYESLRAWSRFYDGYDFPDENCGNPVVQFIYALRRAEADGVKNFVIDVSKNGGGFNNNMSNIFGIINEKASFYEGTTDKLTGERWYYMLKVDRNFDRYFDERDDEVTHNLNIVVLEGSNTFSAANTFAMRMKESGYLVLGQKSGGGSCSVQYLTTADGFMWRISSAANVAVTLVDKNYDVDLGAVPDIELIKKDANGDYPRIDIGGYANVIDYSEFYNVENMKRVINNYFAAKEARPSHSGGKGGSASADVVVSSENGDIKVAVSKEAVDNAAKEGKPVTLSMKEAEPSADAANAPTVTIDLPAGTSKAKVEIPVKDVSPSIVAVLVKADGTEEIITKTMMSENGIVAELKDGETIKIVDNHKEFNDVSNSWAKDDIDFITARGVFNGTGNGAFDPTGDMTRGMLMTVLARYDGVDASGADWQEKGAAWAKENNISDGTGLTEKVTREQLVTMLWRYAGSPVVTDDAKTAAYADAGQVKDYAKLAMEWAVETGLIQGSAGNLDPDGNAQRGQLAAIMHRFMVLMESK